MKFNSVDELLDFAIDREEEAAKFYEDLSKTAKNESMKKVFTDFSKEELGHKQKLSSIKEGKLLASASSKVMDLQIAESTPNVKPGPDMTYQQALTVAMKREKESYKLYNDLALLTDDDGVRGTLLMLAQEEAKHKLRFEIEYDENILTEN